MTDALSQGLEELDLSGDRLLRPLSRRMQEIKRKFDREMALPPEHVDFVNRADLLDEIQKYKRDIQRFRGLADKGKQMHAELEIGLRQRFSSKSLDTLELISVSELMVRRIHEGRYLLCRTIFHTVYDSTFAILVAGEDPSGNPVYLKFFNHPMLMDATEIEMDSIVFPIGTVLAIREPFYVGGAFSDANGFPFVKVDSPSDIVVLNADHDILRDVSWKTKLEIPAGCPRPPVTGEAWKARGTKEFKSGRWFASAMCFTKCIDIDHELQVSRLNRSEVYLRLGWNNSAYHDAKMALDSGSLDDAMKKKAVVRMVKAQYALGHYGEVIEIAKSLAEDSASKEWAAKASKRKTEQKSGSFEWATLFKEAHQSRYVPDFGDYTGPLRLGLREGPTKLRGTFATRDVKVGELLTFHKPICSYWERKDNNGLAFTIRHAPLRKDFGSQPVYRLICAIIQKVWDDGNAYASVKSLYDGGHQTAPIELTAPPERDFPALGNPLRPAVDIDVDYIFGTVLTNTFKCKNVFSSDLPHDKEESGMGLYRAPSLMNHSCVPAAHTFFIGDAMVVRATRDLKKGEEVTDSYVPISPYDGRHTLLKENWGFECTCELCENEGKDSADNRKKRGELYSTMSDIFDEVAETGSPDTLKQLLAKAKVCYDQMSRTYTANRTTGTNADLLKSELAEVARWYATCLEKMSGSQTSPVAKSSSYKRVLELRMDSLEQEGFVVYDRSISGPIINKRKTPHPINLGHLTRMHDFCIRSIFRITVMFDRLGERRRAQRWFDAAVELENLCKGGGKEVFKMFRGEVLAQPAYDLTKYP